MGDIVLVSHMAGAIRPKIDIAAALEDSNPKITSGKCQVLVLPKHPLSAVY